MPDTGLLEVRGLSHAYGGVQAVREVDLTFRPGEVCAVLGENGAGKSTLMKAVAGAIRPDAGEVRFDGEPLPRGDPGAVRRRGVSLIYQELNLVDPLPVWENITLGSEPKRGLFLDREAGRSRAAALLADLEEGIAVDAPVETLSVAEQQLVEIARALSVTARVLIMDEPTSALSDRETERLFGIVRRLADAGTAIVYITHKLDEVFTLADRVVVMRDGRVVADAPAGDFDESALVTAMVGRPLEGKFPPRRRTPGDVVLAVRDLVAPPRVKGVSFQVRAGEIVALAGLVGAGRTEVGRVLFGADVPASGTVTLDGHPLLFRHPQEAIDAGIGWVSEDRKAEGLVLSMSVLANITLPHLASYRRTAGLIDRGREHRDAAAMVERLRVRTDGVDRPVSSLSGGNQQKVAMARWLLEDCRLLICDEPTRGVDVGGRFDIYELLEGLAERGVAVLMISSDLPEVLGMADRAVVMHDGRITGEVVLPGAGQEEILRMAMGIGT